LNSSGYNHRGKTSRHRAPAMKACIFFFYFLLMACFVHSTLSATEVSGIIRKHVRWTLDKSPYDITDDLYITETGKVTVVPGVEIRVGKPMYYNDSIPQNDGLDSQTIAITVEGVFRCTGRMDNHVKISARDKSTTSSKWYGIILAEKYENFSEIAFTEISGANYGILVKGCSPTVRNSLIEFNNVGIKMVSGANLTLVNSIVAHNFTSGIILDMSSPEIQNCIIAFNQNYGVWCDGISRMEFKYNCLYGNLDGDLVRCDPRFAILEKKNKQKDSVDYADNLYVDPIFAGSPSDSTLKSEGQQSGATQISVQDTTLAKITSLQDSVKKNNEQLPITPPSRYRLSKYSPCIDAGNPKKAYRDMDGSLNDMGIFGGPEFTPSKK